MQICPPVQTAPCVVGNTFDVIGSLYALHTDHAAPNRHTFSHATPYTYLIPNLHAHADTDPHTDPSGEAGHPSTG